MKSNIWGKLWTIFMIFAVLTWILWFFGYDIRDAGSKIKDSFTDIKANMELDSKSQQQNSRGMSSSQTTTSQEEELIKECKESYETCKNMYEKKWDASITLLQSQKFDDYPSANQFYSTWAGPEQSNKLTGYYEQYGDTGVINPAEQEDYFPMILFATRVHYSTVYKWEDMPYLFVCSKGKIALDQWTRGSRMQLFDDLTLCSSLE